MPRRPTVSMRVFRLLLRPRALPTTVSFPSSEVCMMGLMDSMVPTKAVAAETRPPFFR